MDTALTEPIVRRLTALLAMPVARIDRPTDLAGRTLVGGVVAVRGAWWGVVIVRSDIALIDAIARRSEAPETSEELMRRFASELTRVVVEHLDPTANMSAPVALAADTARWEPSSAWLQSRVEVHVGEHLVIVEVHRRRKSGEVAATSDKDSSELL